MFNPNLLIEASSVIPFEEFEYIEFDDNVINEMGIKQPTYKEPIKLKGSIQPINSNLYQQLNLDLQKEYYTVWTTQKINTTIDKEYNDMIKYNDNIYTVVKITNWDNYNKWTEITAVKEKNV